MKREEEWTLEKEQNGLYEVKKRGSVKAEIITPDYSPVCWMGLIL
jgi:hypothetical protein